MIRKIAIALAVVAMLAAALLMLRHKDERAARARRAEAHLPSFDDRQVTGVRLEARTTTWCLERTPSGWRITAPVKDVADPRAVEALIAAARRAPIVQTLKAPEALSAYGLEPPVARLTLEGVTTPSLELGRIAPTGEAVFARISGRPEVLLLGLPDAAPLAEADPSALRDRALVDLARSAIVDLALSASGVQLTRGENGWWIAAPRRFPAATARVDMLLGAIYGAKVAGWDDTGDPSDAKYGLGPLARRITLRAPDAARVVTLGGEAGNGRLFALCEGRKTILIVDGPPPDAIPSDPESLRETRLTNVNRYEVKRLVYDSGGARFAATRKDDATWTTEAGDAIPAERVTTLLVALLGAETVSWSDGRLPAKPTATLTYETDKGGVAGSLAFAGNSATWDALPGVVFRLASSLPPVPSLP